jgi:hypothetical protein
MHIGNIAHRVGNKKLTYDAEAERFIDCPEANELLRYAYRGKYQLPEKI